MNDKIEKYKKIAMVALIGLIGLAVAPFVFVAIGGLIGLATAALIGTAMISLSPYVAMKFANWKVKAIAYEAGENPIETMTNLLIAKRAAFDEFKRNVTESITARATFEQKCKVFGAQYPARAAEFQSQLIRMSSLVDQKKQALLLAADQLTLGEQKLDEMKAYWDMSKAAIELNAAAGMDTGDLYERLKADTAVDAVFNSMNRAFAELETAAALVDDKSLQLTQGTPNVINATISTSSKVTV